MEALTSFIKIENNTGIISQFDEQDDFLINSVKVENRKKVKQIIAEYELLNPLNIIFKKYINDYDGLKNALNQYSSKRQEDIRVLIKDL